MRRYRNERLEGSRVRHSAILMVGVGMVAFALVGCASAPAPRIEAAAPPTPLVAPADVRRIAAVGDTGTGGEQQLAVAKLIQAADDETDFDLLVLLGDMVYEVGDPSLVEDVVLAPYADTLDGGTVLVPTLGNHDVRSGGGDQIMAKLGAPGRWYVVASEHFTVIVLDSTRPKDPDQLAFLERSLAAVSSQWVVVAMHHPPYSAGAHGSDEVMQEVFVPLFVEYGVDLVLAGHDHDYQRSHSIDGVIYLISGAGAKLRPTGAQDFTATSASIPHFVVLTVGAETLAGEAIAAEGVIDRFTLTKDE